MSVYGEWCVKIWVLVVVSENVESAVLLLVVKRKNGLKTDRIRRKKR